MMEQRWEEQREGGTGDGAGVGRTEGRRYR